MKKIKKALSLFIYMLMVCFPLSVNAASTTELIERGNWAYKIRDDGTAEIMFYLGSDYQTITVPKTIDEKTVTYVNSTTFVGYLGKVKKVFIPSTASHLPFDDLGIEVEIYQVSGAEPPWVEIPDIPDGYDTTIFDFTDTSQPGFSFEVGDDGYWDGANIIPPTNKVSVISYRGKTIELIEGVDYKVDYSIEENWQGKAVFTGLARYHGTRTVTFFISTPIEFTYNIISEENKTCEITGYTGNTSALNIPEEIDGYTVININGDTFSGKTNIKSITLPETLEGFFWPDSLKSLENIYVKGDNGEFASFDGILYDKNFGQLVICPYQKKEVYVPNTVAGVEIKYIRSGAFAGNELLEKIILPDTLKSIGNRAFYGCKNLKEISIPDSMTGGFGSSAFAYCEKLKSINVPYGVTRIEADTFIYCSSLKSIRLPSTVKSIGSDAFYKSFLESIYIESSNMFGLEGYCIDPSTIIYGNPNAFEVTLYAEQHGNTFIPIVKNPTYENLFGDIDGNKKIELKDLSLFQQYLAGWEVQVVTENLDVNQDGAINMKDLSTLQQTLAN